MGYGFFRPTKFKILLFFVISFALSTLPVVPVLNVPLMVIPDVTPGPQWSMEIPIIPDMTGSDRLYFGVFAGTQAGFLNVLYMLAVGYVLACVLLYFFHKIKG
jgi:hypothetical protein